MHTQQGRGPHTPRSARGFTLIELMVSFSALLIVLLGFSRMLLSSHMASNTTHEATLAKEAARATLEVVQAAPFAEIYRRYNANPADDPGGAGTASGAGFAVRGLEAPEGDNDGLPGQIFFPEQNGALCETINLPQYGWPTDMNGDGDADDTDVSSAYQVIPVVVRVEWRGSGGKGTVELKTVVGSF